MKVGDLVRYLGKEVPVQWLGIIVGFDEVGDPIVKTCCSGIKCAHWRDSLEVLS